MNERTGRGRDELRSVTLQNARSIFLARQRAEEELVRAKEELSADSRNGCASRWRASATRSSRPTPTAGCCPSTRWPRA